MWERFSFYGGVVVMAGHIALAVIPGLAGVAVGLVLVALGSGALKANASSLLGTLYDKGDARAGGGFTLFYLGVNLGAFIGPLITGLLQTHAGFHYGFGAAAIGMALGLGQYVMFRRNLGDHGRDVPNPLPHNRIAIYAGILVVAIVVVAVVIATGLVTLANLSQVTTGVIVAASIAYFAVLLTSSKVDAIERTRVRAFIPLFIANAVFWSLFQQIFTVLAVYSDERMNWSIFGWTAPSSWIGSIEPVWIILLSLVFAIVWTRLGNRAPSTPRKFGYGVVGMGAAFLLFLRTAGTTGQGRPRPVGRWGHSGVRSVGADALADWPRGDDSAGAERVSGTDDGAVLLLGRPWHVDVGRARQVLRRSARVRLVRHHRRGGDRRGRGGSGHLRLGKPTDGGRSLNRRSWPSCDLS
ncbi:MAG: proton-dependent oligopeptide transporter, family [Mycobacterium sp.]|nr:proton-dependent oligopeptide transporter, family [Mycobacterium sp.]